MEIKQVPTNTITRNLSELAKPTGNIYETVMIIAKRANQISANVKQELSQKLEEFSNYADTLEETFENREQIEISKHYERLPKPTLVAIEESKHYERLPKPTLVAIEEFRNGEIYYRKVDEQQ